MALFLFHLSCVGIIGRLPRWIAMLLIAAFGGFLWIGFAG